MTISNWLTGSCGKSHVGIYICSRCGYELLRSGFESTFKKPNVKILPTPTSAESGRKSGFQKSMVADFTERANLGTTFHKNSLVRTILDADGNGDRENKYKTKYEIACGQCGNSLGQQMFYGGYSTYNIKVNSIDLTFRAS